MIVMEPTKHELWHIEHPWSTPLSLAKQRCNNSKDSHYKDYGGRGIKFLLSMEEGQKLWIRDGAQFLNCPSIDREDNNSDYTFDNCRFIEHTENVRRAQAILVLQYNLDGNFIKEWESASEAGRKLNISISSICNCCKSPQWHKTAGGFKWKYK